MTYLRCMRKNTKKRRAKKQEEYVISVRMPVPMWEEAADWAETNRRTVSFVIREALSEYFERRES